VFTVKVAVLGAGSWGTTLASSLSSQAETMVWAREPEVADAISSRHENPVFLPGFVLPDPLRASDDIEQVLHDATVIVFAVPSRYLRTVADIARPLTPADADLVSVAKGIEPGTCMRMTEVIQQVLECDPSKICVLAGPNLAREVMARQPSATVVACDDLARAQRMQRLFMTDSLRVYTNPDVVGCEIGGAVKNVIAIAAGIADGLGYGWNTKAALITRGLAELARLGVALGGAPLTFLGLAGNGDLTATCSSPQSRNRGLGEELGKGRSLEEILSTMRMVAEGVGTTPGVLTLADRSNVDMPISREVADVLVGTVAPADIVARLMNREAKPELHDLTR
jgi:glycerol-3-phosphate dehydrogenase (NAD(P)+)